MGSDHSGEPRKPSLEVSFGRKKREERREEQVIEHGADRVEELSLPTEAPAAEEGRPVEEAQPGADELHAGDEQTGASERPSRRTKLAKAATQPRQPKPRAAKSLRQPKERRQRAPWGVLAASLATGVVVGLVMVGAAYGALRGCASLRGTASCGGAGFPVLLVILAVGVILGGVLLRLLSQTPSATSISFLAVAFVAVVSGLFLLDALDDWPALVIVPVLSVLGYLGSHWVTTHYIEPMESAGTAGP